MTTPLRASVLPAELVDVRVAYGRQLVLDRFDLRVDAGRVTALLGPNGAGKTTAIHVLIGLQPPTSGRRRLGAQEAPEVGLGHRAAIAWVGHHPQLAERATVRENVELALELARAAGDDVVHVRDADEWMRRFEVDALTSRIASQLSRGQAQRAALARAFARRPELLVLDEPFTALDGHGRAALVAAIVEARSRGVAILLTSHDLDAVAAVADAAVWLEDGRAVAQWPDDARTPLREALARWTAARA